MQSLLDTAITKAAAAEATYQADTNNVATIKAAIETATTPLSPAVAQQTTDAAAFNAALDELSAAALAAKV
jgi:fructose/tagatose bisphosphate aldolase